MTDPRIYTSVHLDDDDPVVVLKSTPSLNHTILSFGDRQLKIHLTTEYLVALTARLNHHCAQHGLMIPQLIDSDDGS